MARWSSASFSANSRASSSRAEKSAPLASSRAIFSSSSPFRVADAKRARFQVGQSFSRATFSRTSSFSSGSSNPSSCDRE